MKLKQVSTLVLISILILACNFSSVTPQEGSNPEQEGIEGQRLDSAEPDSLSESTPADIPAGAGQATPGQSLATPIGSPPAPAPTAANPGSNPGGSNPGGSSSASSSQPLTIGSVNSSPNTTVYYGNCAAADPTLLHVEAAVDPLDQVQNVILWYDIFDPGGVATSGSTAMWQLGIGDYAGDINIGQIGAGSMGTNDGSAAFWIEAVNKDGDSTYSSTYAVNIEHCPDAVVGNPPVAPPAILSFTGNGPVQAGEWVELAWQTGDASCGVTLDGNIVDADGYFSYGTSSGDAGKTFNHSLVASGGSCSSPAQVSQTLTISITPAVTVSKGSGTLYDEQYLDLGDGAWDVMFDYDSGDTVLAGLSGTYLLIGTQANVAECKSQLSRGGTSPVDVSVHDIVCYQTSSGNYGYLTVTGMYIDLDNPSNSSMDISYNTEVVP